VVRDFLANLQADPQGMFSATYLSRDLQGQVVAGQAVADLLHLPGLYRAFTVSGADPAPGATSTTVRAILDYPAGPQRRDITLIADGGVWRINAISVPNDSDSSAGPPSSAGSTPAAPSPAPATPAGTEAPPSAAPPTVERVAGTAVVPAVETPPSAAPPTIERAP